MVEEYNAALSEERVRQDITARLAAGSLAGVCAGVWLHGLPQLEVCLGWRDPLAGVPMRRDTLFRLASMTKPVTGVAVLQQWQRGKLDLDTPVSHWLPGFADMRVALDPADLTRTCAAARAITPRMLLCHASGLGSGPAGDAQYAALGPANHQSLAAAVEAYSGCVLDFQPGTQQMYSPALGMDVLARLVELTADRPYDEYLAENLFAPLEMPDTTYRPTAGQLARVMTLVDARDGALQPTGLPAEVGFGDFPPGYTGGGAGLFSTLEDYSHFAQMLADGGVFRGRRLLPEAAVLAMAAPQLPESFAGILPTFNWGLAVRVCPQRAPAGAPWPGQPLTPGSFGWSGAYGAHFWVDRQRGLTAVYLSNLLDGGGAGAPTAFAFEHAVMAGFSQG